MKVFLVLFCVFFIPVLSFGQFSWGVKAGASFSGYHSESASGLNPEYKYQPGFQAGVFAEQQLSERFSLQPELLFSFRRAKASVKETYSIPSTTGYTTLELEMTSRFSPLYLDLPVYFKMNVMEAKTGKLSLGLGPAFSYGLGGKVKVDGKLGSDETSGEQKLFKMDEFVWTDDLGNQSTEMLLDDAPFKRFDFGMGGLAAYELPSGLAFSLSAQYGLINISNDEEEDLFTRSVSFGISYRF